MNRWAQGFLGLALVMSIQLYAIAELVLHEPPRGSFVGRVYSERTRQPIPNTEVRLIRQSEPDSPYDNPESMPLLFRQGWQPDDAVYSFPQKRVWSVRTDAQGRFAFRGIPEGTYLLYAQSEAHSLRGKANWEEGSHLQITIGEGERMVQDLYLKPNPDFLHLVHPQAVYYPDESLRIGVRGFSPSETLFVEVFAVKPQPAYPSALFTLLNELHYGWWRSTRELDTAIRRVSGALSVRWSQTLPVIGRDPEGVFMRYVEIPRQPEGVYIARVRLGEAVQAGLMLISPFGIVSKIDGEEIEYWCVDLRRGHPVRNVALELHHNGAETTHIVAKGRTNAQGLWRFRSRELPNETTYYLLARSPDGTRILHWASMYHYASRAYDERLYGTIYTDRPIYRPGHIVYYKGIVRVQKDTRYRLVPPGTPVHITVRDPRGETYTTQTLTLNDYASFTGQLYLSSESLTGMYSLTAEIPDYGIIVENFPVSAYRLPAYRIQANPEKTLYLVGETAEIAVRTEYYFGMPVPNTKIRYSLYRQPYRYYTPEDETDDYWNEPETGYGTIVAEGEATTDGQGRLRLQFPTRTLIEHTDTDQESTTAPYPFLLELTGLSEGWESAQATARFEVAPSVWQITLEPEQWFGEPDQSYPIKVQVRDIRTGQPVQATLQVKAGAYEYAGRYRVTRYPFRTTLQTDIKGEAILEWTPPTEGEWQIVVFTHDPNRAFCAQAITLWVFGKGELAHPDIKNPMEVRLQKTHYAPGETAEVAIRCPYPDAVYYVSLEGDRLFRSAVVQATGTLTRVKLPITAEQIPNAYVSVCMVRNKEMFQRELPLRVGTRQVDLKLTVQTDKERYAPQETVQVRVRATDSNGTPVRAELSLAVVDEAIFSVWEDDPNQLHRAFYAKRWNRVRTSFSAPYLLLQGDKGEPQGIRKEFPDTAFWLPDLRTDARGTAQATFRLPDTLTEWRLTVRGHTLKTEVGYAKAHIKTSKPLMVRLRLPLWLIEGDKTELNAIISNDTPQRKTVQVEWHLPDSTHTQQISVAPNDSLALSYPYTAHRVGQHTVRVAVSELGGSLRDAEQRTFEVKPAGSAHHITRTLLLKGEQTLVLPLPPDALENLSTLEIATHETLLQFLTEKLDELIDYPYGCVEQTVSRFVPAVLALQMHRRLGYAPPPALATRTEKAISIGLQRLAKLQSADGSWSWWSASEPDLWITAYVIRSLYLAKQAGVPVPDKMYQSGVESLERIVQGQLIDVEARILNEQPALENLSALADALGTLAEIGRPIPKALRENPHLLTHLVKTLYPQQDNSRENSHVAGAGLMLALLRWRDLPNSERHLKYIWERMRQVSIENADTLYWVQHEGAEVQAQMLHALFAIEPVSTQLGLAPNRYRQIVEKTALALLLWQKGGGWYSSYDTAWSIQALLEYVAYEKAHASHSMPSVRVWVNDKPVSDFQGSMRLESQWLQRGENRIRLRAEGGVPIVSVRLRYWRPLHYGEPLSAPVQVALYVLEPGDSVDTPANKLRRIPLDGVVRAGTVMRLDVEIQASGAVPPIDYTVLEVPFPAGCVPIDTQAFLYSWWWSSTHSEFRDDRALSFRSFWEREAPYRFSILLRAEVPGEYSVLPSVLWGMYTPSSISSDAFRLVIRE